jgi:hypothetical protein
MGLIQDQALKYNYIIFEINKKGFYYQLVFKIIIYAQGYIKML